MSKHANPVLIGSFVLGAMILAVGSVLLLAGNQLFFSQTERFVMYFDSSVKGLTVGSPVMFRGVNIGTVVSMQLVVAENNVDISIPVIVEIDTSNFVEENPDAHREALDIDGEVEADEMERLINAGLRAQLQLQSLLTGQLFIQFDFYPGTEFTLRKADLHKNIDQIPTIPTPIEQITKKLEDFPLDKVLETLASTLKGIDALVNSSELTDSIQALHSTLRETESLMTKLNTRADPVTTNLNGALVDARAVMQNLNGAIDDAQEAARQAESTLQSADAIMKNEQILLQLETALQAVTQAAHSIRLLADAVERQPNMLIRGRQ